MRSSSIGLAQKMMTTRRDFLKTAAAAPLGIIAVPGLSAIREDRDVAGTGPLADALYLGKPMNYWLARMRNDKADKLIKETKTALAHFGSAAVPHLIEAFGFRDEESLYTAELALAEIGATAVSALHDALRHGNPLIRCWAAETLIYSAVIARESRTKPRWDLPSLDNAVMVLTEVLKDKDVGVRRLAAHHLTGCSRIAAIPFLIEALEDPDPSVRMSAAHAIGNSGGHAENAIPALIKVLTDPDHWVRMLAARAIGDIDQDHHTLTIPVLIEVLENHPIDSDGWRADEGAAEALDSLGPLAWPALEQAFKRGGSRVRITILQQPYSKDPGVVSILLQGLNDEDGAVRREAAWSLSRRILNDETGRAAVSALSERLKNDRDLRVRMAAATGIALVEPTNDLALKTLLAGLIHGDLKVREDAVAGLKYIDPPVKAAVPTLVDLLKDGCIRRGAIQALSSIGSDAEEAIPALIQVLREDKGGALQSVLAGALGEIGPASILPLLRELQQGDQQLRCRVIKVLGDMAWRLWPEGKRPAVPALMKFLKDPEVRVRALAAETLGKIDSDPRSSVPALCEALKDRDIAVRSKATEALGWIGSEAKAAKPCLASLLKDPIEAIRRKAQKALSVIR